MKDSINSVIKIFRYIGYILTAKQKRESIYVFISMIVCSLLELLGVSAIYPFLLLLMDENAMRGKPYISWIYSVCPDIENESIIIILGIIIALIYVLKNAMFIYCTYIQNAYSAKINRELSVKILKSYMIRPYEFFVNTDSSIIMRGLNGDVSSVYNIILSAFQIFAEVFTIMMIVLYLIKIDVFIAMGSIVAGAICFLAITVGFKKIMKQLGKESRRLSYVVSGCSYQIINGIKEITVLDRKDCFVDMYDSHAEKNAAVMKKTQMIGSIPDRLLETACIIVVMTVLCIKICNGVDTHTFFPLLGAFVMGVFRIMPSISRISGRVNNVVYFMPGLDNAYGIIKDSEKIECEHIKEEIELSEILKNTDYSTKSFENEIVVKDVHWRYLNGTDEVLKGVNLIIKRGESIGLIGSSGGGKSTLVDVLMSLFRPQIGTVTMDGIDIFLMKYRWRRLIGYVPQSVFLTGDSIRANVAFGLPKDEISDEKVWKALEQAQLMTFIKGLPERLNTTVGERGIKLSGGQRQRVAIARALYDEPEILILDEATAALDNDTEKAFMEAIEQLQGKKTIILVAHRLTTVRNCDRIYEIKDGKAIERDVKEVMAGV